MRWRMDTTASSSQDSNSGSSMPPRPLSASLDEGEADETSSQDPLHADETTGSVDLHGRLGNSEPNAPMSAGEPINTQDDYKESSSSQEEEKKQSDDAGGGKANDHDPGKSSSSSSSRQVIEDDDGADHAEPQTPPVPWKPQNVQSTCEFTHTILDYAQKRESGCKKAEYSSTTVDDFGNRWRLIVYVNGNGRASNHHLSLFLQVADAEDLPFGWKKAVSYVLTLEHPDGGNRSYAKRNPDKTFKLCPKAIDWGWSQFITSDRIQQEGFVLNDSLTVRASVTVKSSSVSIDQDDSELYLKCAVEEGDADAVKLCLDQGASVNCKFKDDLYTPLHTACSSGTNTGSMDVLTLLLERGADGNACNKWKETPLLIAANNGHRAAVEALLKHGADPSLCSEAGWSALTFAAHKGYEDIVALLLRAGAPVNCRVTEDASTPLHKACAGSKSGHLAAVKLLLDGDADVHSLNKWRETPLLTAANHGQAGAVEALLKAGADPCKCTDTGWSPLSIAAYKGHDDVVRLLLEEGAPTEEDDPTLSALLQAATKGLPDTVELLLLHGADHTVTTKKGDTALSILVEQNLIDAAVDMVSEYNASIPRCSRDRKKVQRARLLINLRLKQLEREGKAVTVSTDDDETDDESEESKLAQHDENALVPPEASSTGKKKKKGKKSAEDKAKAAEEALLLELEQEDEKAKVEEAKANSKQAKKKKKKEREREQKMKEEQERLEVEDRETKEQERLKMERETKEQKEREKKRHAQREREMKDMVVAQEKAAVVAKRKEREEQERRLQEQKGQEELAVGETSSPLSLAGSSASEKREKAPQDKKSTARSTPQTSANNATAAAPLAGNRRWETKAKPSTTHTDVQKIPPDGIRSLKDSAAEAESQAPELPSSFLSPRPEVPEANGDTSSFPSFEKDHSAQSSPEPASDLPAVFVKSAIEHPAIALFRRDKVAELIQRCTHALDVVDELTIKRVIHRWVVRASHEQTRCADPIIPSWVEFDKLVAFFQRQFISESRRGAGTTRGEMAGMETLKEAGSSVAVLCQNLAKEVSEVRRRIEEQLPRDWTDAALGMTASDGTHNGSGSVVTISWANRSQIYLPTMTFAALRDRHTGPPNRFLTALFVSKIWHETNRLVVVDTTMDFRLSPDTLACLSTEADVSVELWTDPFSAWNGNVFWGKFDGIDSLFGGQTPFGKDERGGEEVLARHGGSIAVLLPFDNMIASRYMQRMLDILDGANSSNVAVSFVVFLRADCFHDLPSGLSGNDLRLLDSRLVDQQQSYVRYTEVLPARQHRFHCGEGVGTMKVDSSDSLFVLLQSRAGMSRFAISDASISRIISSMSVNLHTPRNDKPIVTPMGFTGDYAAMQSPHSPHSGYFDGLAPIVHEPQRAVRSDFGAIGGVAAYSQPFSPSEPGPRLTGARRGRLFDLVDDLEEDQLNDDVDLVSGMLNNLDVGLFQNSNNSSDVDIEAISLMGIGGPPSESLPPRNSHSRRFG